jgi:hypothetical protein
LRLLFRMPRAVIRLLSEGNRGFGPPSGPRFDCTPPPPPVTPSRYALRAFAGTRSATPGSERTRRTGDGTPPRAQRARRAHPGHPRQTTPPVG